MTDKFYKKVGRRYHEVGREFAGFPSNGIFLVIDGSYSRIIRIAEIGELPISTAVNYRQHKNNLAQHIVQNRADGMLSPEDIAYLACDYFANVAENDEGKFTKRKDFF